MHSFMHTAFTLNLSINILRGKMWHSLHKFSSGYPIMKLKMIGVRFKGRLGNQLFQYCFLMYLKSKRPGKFFFFPNPHHASLARYFDLGFYHNLTLNSKLYSLFTRVLPSVMKFEEAQLHNFVAPKDISVKDNTIYNGYFQSDFYIKQLPEDFTLRIKKKFREKFYRQYGPVFEKGPTLAVHIRRTDYLTYGKRDISLPIEYYHRELSRIENLGSYTVFFTGDDISYIRSSFGEKPNFIFSENDAITDFQIIQHADIAIISNSTFAWWAAYLSEKP